MIDVKIKVRKVRKQGWRNEKRKRGSLERNKKQRKEGRKIENSNNFTSQIVFSALLLEVYLCILVRIWVKVVNEKLNKLWSLCEHFNEEAIDDMRVNLI